jgi:hypothetical protein
LGDRNQEDSGWSKTEQKVHKMPSQPMAGHKVEVGRDQSQLQSYTRKANRRITVQDSLYIKQGLSQKQPTQKGLMEWLEC